MPVTPQRFGNGREAVPSNKPPSGHARYSAEGRERPRGRPIKQTQVASIHLPLLVSSLPSFVEQVADEQSLSDAQNFMGKNRLAAIIAHALCAEVFCRACRFSPVAAAGSSGAVDQRVFGVSSGVNMAYPCKVGDAAGDALQW